MFPYIHFIVFRLLLHYRLEPCVYFLCSFRSMSCGSHLNVDVKMILKWILEK
jgi:hypothetical protein